MDINFGTKDTLLYEKARGVFICQICAKCKEMFSFDNSMESLCLERSREIGFPKISSRDPLQHLVHFQHKQSRKKRKEDKKVDLANFEKATFSLDFETLGKPRFKKRCVQAEFVWLVQPTWLVGLGGERSVNHF